ncbi:MAG: hypothetical protein AB1782_09915 [Cyanobacteriota bacterium]
MKISKAIQVSVLVFFYVAVNIQIYAEKLEVPAGRTVEVKTDVMISSETNNNGDPVIVTISQGFYNDGELILPAGSKIEGKIIELEHASEGNNGAVKVHFDSVYTPSGEKIPISAIVETEDGTGILWGHGLSKAGKLKKAFVGIGTKTAERAAEGAIVAAALPKKVRNAMKYGATAGAGIGIVEGIKEGNKKEAVTQTAKQVVKYTPYGQVYKYGNIAIEGVKNVNQINSSDGVGHEVNIKRGSDLELVLQKPILIEI